MPLTTYSCYQPMLEFTRGQTVESVHHGAAAVANARGELVAWFGDPKAITFMRSSAKPLQALPFIERDGQVKFGLTPREIAIICASHSGTDEHVAVLRSIQSKAGISEDALLCGVHLPLDGATTEAMRERNEQPTPNRHNCSGKHSGMLAFARLQADDSKDEPSSLDYINPQHPIQHEILQAVAAMCQINGKDIQMGIDGCSAPNFALPLFNAAVGYARLCDPLEGQVSPLELADACRTVTSAMMANPDMVGGPRRFDTRLMEVTGGRIVAKGGAEGYQGIGLLPGAMGMGSPALGIALKIADGDQRGKAGSAVSMEVLRQLGALSDEEIDALAEFGPTILIQNWRKILVGRAAPIFELVYESERAGVDS